ncbi:hypothetical protein OIU84_002550 [Salix udensis]|uniref:Ubiquitin-like modifier-activating enzyme Atg7 N-terminal domain-containing protein n=1 Tax=Salix udensis TaxID=889485 RepID=A0AAD6K5X4_9ROSI|nr:hypothetical protein OIU84_002550 [Salix udensis]
MAREERSGNGCGGSSSSSTILQFVPFCSLVDEGFWQRLSYLKLNKHGIGDSPIPITGNGLYAPCSHSRVSNHLTLLAESLPTDKNGQSSMPALSRGNRNRCPVPGTLYNTNTLETFHALDKKEFAKGGSKQAISFGLI